MVHSQLFSFFNYHCFFQRIGFEKFLHNHPDNFAIIDDKVHLLENADIPFHLLANETEVTPPIQNVVKSNLAQPPADSAFDSISKIFQYYESLNLANVLPCETTD